MFCKDVVNNFVQQFRKALCSKFGLHIGVWLASLTVPFWLKNCCTLFFEASERTTNYRNNNCLLDGTKPSLVMCEQTCIIWKHSSWFLCAACCIFMQFLGCKLLPRLISLVFCLDLCFFLPETWTFFLISNLYQYSSLFLWQSVYQ